MDSELSKSAVSPTRDECYQPMGLYLLFLFTEHSLDYTWITQPGIPQHWRTATDREEGHQDSHAGAESAFV